MPSALRNEVLEESYFDSPGPEAKIVPLPSYGISQAQKQPRPAVEDYAIKSERNFNELNSMVEEVRKLLLSRPQPTSSASQNVAPTAQQKFESLAERWKKETLYCSSVLEMAMHPAYQQIIGMGRTAIPFMLKDLKEQPRHWFWALRAISGEDPVPPNARGDVLRMTQAWLVWGARSGYEF